QLLAFGRTQVQQVQIVDLNVVVFDLEQMVRIMLPGNVDVRIQAGREPVKLRVDRFQAEQIILELVVGARDAMPKGGTLTIETSNCTVDEEFSRQHPAVPPGEYAVLKVTDTGEGTDAEHRFQHRPPFTRSTGSGLAGFQALQAAIRLADGHLWSYSE